MLIIISIQFTQLMGCVQTVSNQTPQIDSTPLIGILTIRVHKTDFKLMNMTALQIQQYCLKVWISNQLYEITLNQISLSAKGYEMSFILNKKLSNEDRTLNMQIQNILNPDPKNTAFGVNDLDLLVLSKKFSKQQIYLNYINKKACMIEYEACFKRILANRYKAILTYPIWYKLKRKHTKIQMKFIIGEQILEFSMNPNASNESQQCQTKQFYIPHCLSTANMQILQDSSSAKNMLGSSLIHLNRVIFSKKQVSEIQQTLVLAGKNVGAISVYLYKLSDVPNISQSLEFETQVQVLEQTQKQLCIKQSSKKKQMPHKLPPLSLMVKTKRRKPINQSVKSRMKTSEINTIKATEQKRQIALSHYQQSN